MATIPPLRETGCLTVAFIGNPNTGKSTLFNSLSGMRARVGNYPGVTVEKKIGRANWADQTVRLVDLPGTYSLSARTLDEMVSVDVLLGRQDAVDQPDAVVCVADASNLERNLYLVSQILDLDLPVVLVLNMSDVARSRGVSIDVAALGEKLGIPVVETEAHRQRGLDGVRRAIVEVVNRNRPSVQKLFPAKFYEECDRLGEMLARRNGADAPHYLLERMILDVGGQIESHFTKRCGTELPAYLTEVRRRLDESGCQVPACEARLRYAWAQELLEGVVTHPEEHSATGSDKLDRILTHRGIGLGVFCALMFLVFQAIYQWTGPFMQAIESGREWIASLVAGMMPPGALRSLLVDGVIAGVGGVLVFLPQIAFLFFFIALLEDCGYMARAAFLMDRPMTKIGLSGKSFVPLMSSFACAVPGVMATRVIENRRDRMVTILVAPLMSCSARLPVYLLLIAAFIPPATYLNGWITLQGLVLFGASSLGALVAIPMAWFLKKTFLRGETPPFVMELPGYKWPSPRNVLYRVYDRGKAFVIRAGTMIVATTIIVWAAGYFPDDHTGLHRVQAEIERLEAEAGESVPDHELLAPLIQRQRVLSSDLIADSFLGKIGRGIEPAVKPLGWDWRIAVGVIASFPAREVIIATLGTIYSLGGDVDEEHEGLIGSMRRATWPDGRKVYNVPVALSIMVFFALCAQCAATLVTIKRETNSWFWPALTFVNMTTLAYVGALLTYQVGMLFV